MKFESKKDSFYTWTFWIVNFALLGTFFYALLFDDSLSSKIIGCLLTSSIILVSLVFWFNTYYVLTHDNLFIKYGFITKKVPLNTIRSINRSNTMVAGPAFATNKIEITYNNGSDHIFISPKDESVFIDQLVKSNDNTVSINLKI